MHVKFRRPLSLVGLVNRVLCSNAHEICRHIVVARSQSVVLWKGSGLDREVLNSLSFKELLRANWFFGDTVNRCLSFHENRWAWLRSIQIDRFLLDRTKIPVFQRGPCWVFWPFERISFGDRDILSSSYRSSRMRPVFEADRRGSRCKLHEAWSLLLAFESFIWSVFISFWHHRWFLDDRELGIHLMRISSGHEMRILLPTAWLAPLLFASRASVWIGSVLFVDVQGLFDLLLHFFLHKIRIWLSGNCLSFFLFLPFGLNFLITGI